MPTRKAPLFDHNPRAATLLVFDVMSLFVSVSAVARPTSVSVEVGRVSVPVLTMDAITGVVRVGDVASTLLPDPVDVVVPVPPRTTANVPVVIADASRVTADHDVLPSPSVLRKLFDAPKVAGNTNAVNVAAAVVICTPFPPPPLVRNRRGVDRDPVTFTREPPLNVTGPLNVLLVSVSVVALPTSVSVEVGRVSVPVLTMDAITGVIRVGDVFNTVSPVPVDVVVPVPPRTTANVPDVILAAAILIELAAPEMVLFVRVSTVARPTSVSVASGMVIDWFALCWKTSVVLKPVVAGAILNLRSFVESLELTKLVVKSDNVLFVSVSVDVREIIVSFATGFGKVSVLAAKVFTDANVSVPAEANDRSNLSCPTPEIVVVASVRVLLVSVSVVARPTKVSVEVGSVSVPVLTIDAIMGAVSVLLVRVCASVVPTTTPAGATLAVVTAEVPAPTKKFPEASVATPVPPLATGSIPATAAVRLMPVIVLDAPEIVLFVSVCASVVPTTIPAGAAFNVVTTPVPAPTKKFPEASVATPVPPLATGSIPATAAVRLMPVIVLDAPEIVLFVSVSEVFVPTNVVVAVGRVSVPAPLDIVAITGAVSVLFVSVSVVSLPTSLSVDVGRVSVPPLTMDENDGVARVGDVPNTRDPLPVSSLITPASCADVVEANWLSGLLVSAAVVVDHDKLPDVSLSRHPLATVLAAVGRMRL